MVPFTRVLERLAGVGSDKNECGKSDNFKATTASAGGGSYAVRFDETHLHDLGPRRGSAYRCENLHVPLVLSKVDCIPAPPHQFFRFEQGFEIETEKHLGSNWHLPFVASGHESYFLTLCAAYLRMILSIWVPFRSLSHQQHSEIM